MARAVTFQAAHQSYNPLEAFLAFPFVGLFEKAGLFVIFHSWTGPPHISGAAGKSSNIACMKHHLPAIKSKAKKASSLLKRVN
jgi:hypothetical protein